MNWDAMEIKWMNRQRRAYLNNILQKKRTGIFARLFGYPAESAVRAAEAEIKARDEFERL